MRIGIPKEVHAGEKRVATTPEAASQLAKLGFDVAVEAGAGTAASFDDDAYREAFGKLDIATLEREWMSYVQKLRSKPK